MASERYHIGTTGGPSYATKQEWLNRLLVGSFRAQPPDWWVIATTRDGVLKVSQANALWYHFPRERQYIIWDQAPIEDFIARGYYR